MQAEVVQTGQASICAAILDGADGALSQVDIEFIAEVGGGPENPFPGIFLPNRNSGHPRWLG